MGLIGSVFAVASVAGPLLGGFLVDNLSWRWVFYVNMPIGALALVIVTTRLHLHTPHDAPPDRLPRRGAAHRRRRRADPAHDLGRQRVRLGLAGRSSGSRVGGVALLVAFVWQERRAAEPIIPLTLFRSRRVRRRERDGLHDRDGDVRRDHLHPALPAARLRREPDELGPADAAADGRPARRPRSSRAARSPASAATRSSRSPARRCSSSACSCSRGSDVGPHPWVASLYMLVVGVGHRARHAGARARRPERRAPAGHRRRHLDRDVLPLGRRLVRRRASSARSSPRGSRTSSSRLPADVIAKLGDVGAIDPAQAKQLPPEVHADFLQAFANALHGVFLFGAW